MIRYIRTALTLMSMVLSMGMASAQTFIDVKAYADGFVAADRNGKIVFTDIRGIHTDSTMVSGFRSRAIAAISSATCNIVFAGGENGDIYTIQNGKSTRIHHGGPAVNSIAAKGNDIYAACNDGTILIWKSVSSGKKPANCKTVRLDTRDNLVSIAASDLGIFAITAQGTIASSRDGVTWNLLDFNSYYDGYYDRVVFTAIGASDGGVAATGSYSDGSPALFLSTQGSVWSERSLTYKDGARYVMLEATPLGISHDASQDRWVMSCSEGTIFFIPGCSHCNSIEYRPAADIWQVAFNGPRYLAAGDVYLK